MSQIVIANDTLTSSLTVGYDQIALATTVASRGRLTVNSGGTVDGINVDWGGRLTVFSGGTANGTNVYSDGSMTISSGGAANETNVDRWGRLTVFSGGTANETTLNEDGYMYVSNGGTANAVTVLSGGSLIVSSGGSATNIAWTPCTGANLMIGADAYVTFVSSYLGCYYGSSNQLLSSSLSMTGKTISDEEEICVLSNGIAVSTILDGSYLTVYSGGLASATTVSDGRLTVYGGGTASATIVSGGHLSVDGIAEATILNGGTLYVNSGGTAKNVTVYSGEIWVEDGTLTGSLQISSVGSVYLYGNAFIDFLVSEQVNRNEAIINHYDYFHLDESQHNAYTVTINANQESGDYHLADYAQSFSENILVRTTDGTNLGYITGWNDLTVGGRTYGISLNTNGTLIFSISSIQENTPPTITHIQADVTVLTSGDVHVSAVFADETELAQSLYRIGDGDWRDYTGAVTMSDNGTLYFKAVDASGNVTEDSYTVTNIDKVAPVAVGGLDARLAGRTATFTWNTTTDSLAGVARYEFQLSDQADFSHLVTTQSGATLTSYNATLTTTGRYHYRVRATDTVGNSSEWSSGSLLFEAAFESKPVNLTDVPSDKVVQGTAGADLFNLTPNGEWGTLHVARWNGDASASVRLAGRNRYYDALDGAGGYDTVQLAAGDNGLVYSDLLTPSASNADAAARLAGIAEIRGNSGNDLIDMTAARSSYAGDLLLKGGDGDDHLWTGSGDDILIGGSGNDELRGGAGDDIYLFGAGWGRDTVVDDGGTLVFDSTLEGQLAFRAVGNGTRITFGDNAVELNWNVAAGDVRYADVAALTEFRRDTIKGFLA